jgi:hypothetical protein
MRKKMQKEVTKTTVKVAKIVTAEGLPKAETLEDEILLGNVSVEKAQKIVQKKYDEPVTVLGVEPDTTIYEMDVEEFIKHAVVKTDSEDETENVDLPEQA